MNSLKLLFVYSVMVLLPVVGCMEQHERCDDNLSLDAQDTNRIIKSQGCMADVTGLVYQVYKSKNRKITTLNFGSDYKTDFAGVIFSKTKENIGENVIESYAGRRVTVHGVIKIYKPHFYSLTGAPQIIINASEQISVVN